MELVSGEPLDIEAQTIASLEEAFTELDENGLGTLSIEEFQDLLFACGNTATPDEARTIFKSIDTDDSGGIDKDEFIAFMREKSSEGVDASSALAPMLLRAQLQATLLSRMMARRLKAAAADRDQIDDRQENEAQTVSIECKLGDPKMQGPRAALRKNKSKFFFSSLSSSKDAPAPSAPNLGIKAGVDFFPGATNDWPSKFEVSMTLPRREGAPKAKVDKLATDLLQILEAANNHDVVKHVAEDVGLQLGKWKYTLSETALTFSLVVAGSAVTELQMKIRSPMEIQLDQGLPVKSSISVEASLGLSVDALTSEDETVWEESVLSHIDKGTFFKVQADVAAGLAQAVKKLPDKVLHDPSDGWIKYLSRLFRFAKVELGFLRTQDALRHLLEEKQNMKIPDQVVRQFVQSLRDLKVGHLTPFARLVPRVVGACFHKVQQNASLVQQIEMMFFPPAKWTELINNFSSCVTGLGEIKVSLLPSTVATISFTGLDIFKVLNTSPLKPEDVKEDATLKSDFEELFTKLFVEANPTMVKKPPSAGTAAAAGAQQQVRPLPMGTVTPVKGISGRVGDVPDDDGAMTPVKGVREAQSLSLMEAVAMVGIESVAADAFIADEKGAELAANDPYGLNKDVAGAVTLYTMDGDFYPTLNQYLRTRDRSALKRFFPYLKLLLTARDMLPKYEGTVWRGVKGVDMRANYPKGKEFYWWAFSSTTKELSALHSPQFLGTEGVRTVFNIQVKNGVDIVPYSIFQGEEGEAEVLMYPGSKFKVKDTMDMGGDLFMVHLEEINLPVSLFG